MSSEAFPARVDAFKLFTREGSIQGKLALSRLPRLREYLSSEKGSLDVTLHFSRDQQNRRVVEGHLGGEITMQCQRCLEDTPVGVDSAIHLLVASSDEEAQRFPAERESVIAAEEGLDVLAMIEDEVILSLPIAPVHDDPDCNRELNRIKRQAAAVVQEDSPETDEQDNPFAKLKALREALREDDGND